MIELPGKYSVIYADPPWRYSFSPSASRAIERHYPTMAHDDICALPVADLAAEDCALFMWAVNPKLPDAIAVMEAWGFRYVTVAFVWVKTRYPSRALHYGLGRWTRTNAEQVLLGIKGHPQRVGKDVAQIVEANLGAHSEKPDEVRRRGVRLMGDVPRVELFCRERALGWDAWGNEVREPQPTLLDDLS